MLKGDCAVRILQLPYSPQAGCAIAVVTRTVCGQEKTYDLTKKHALRDRSPLEPPPCFCPPTLELWEMI